MIAVAVGALIGIVLGLTGAGGSVMALPMLVLLLGLSPHAATGVSLGAVAASAWFGVAARLRQKEIVWIPALLFATSGALTAPVGQRVAQYFSETVILGGFSGLMLFISYRMWRQAMRLPEETRLIRAGAAKNETFDQVIFETTPVGRRICWDKIGLMAGSGLGTGMLSGFFGVGGGFIIVPVLVFATGMPMKQAVATSLFVVAMISVSGFGSFILINEVVAWSQLSLVAMGGVTGMLVGTLIGRRLAGPGLQKTFAICVLALAAVNVWKLLAG